MDSNSKDECEGFVIEDVEIIYEITMDEEQPPDDVCVILIDKLTNASLWPHLACARIDEVILYAELYAILLQILRTIRKCTLWVSIS